MSDEEKQVEPGNQVGEDGKDPSGVQQEESVDGDEDDTDENKGD
jgi:hypothetical protein